MSAILPRNDSSATNFVFGNDVFLIPSFVKFLKYKCKCQVAIGISPKLITLRAEHSSLLDCQSLKSCGILTVNC